MTEVEVVVRYENQWVVLIHQYLLLVDVFGGHVVRRVVAFEKEHLHDSFVGDSQQLAAIVMTELQMEVLLGGIALVYSYQLPIFSIVHEDRSVVNGRDEQLLVRGGGDLGDASRRLAHGTAEQE